MSSFRVEGWRFHLKVEGEGPMPILCEEVGDLGGGNYLHTSTPDRKQVTCPRCLEWMHA